MGNMELVGIAGYYLAILWASVSIIGATLIIIDYLGD